MHSVSDIVNFDVIVLGVGSMGSAACYYLAKRGVKVLGLEQYTIPNELGSHGGQSRIIRQAYFELPDYVPLLKRAYENWRALEQETGADVYFKTGLLYFGRPDSVLIRGLRESAQRYAIEVNDLSVGEKRDQYPQFSIPPDYDRMFEPDAGFVAPERAILLFADRALQKGAAIHTHERTLTWKRQDDGIVVSTDKQTYHCKKLVVTAGPWAGKLIPGLTSNLSVTRQVLAWATPKNPKAFELDNFPCWTLAKPGAPGIYYGFPILPPSRFGGPVGMKFAHHAPGTGSDPDNVNRVTTQNDEANLVEFLRRYFPDVYESIDAMTTCLYTNTPDEHFILDFVPGADQDVVVAAGFSGHGFKFASVVGEIMADLATKGNTDLPIGFLSAGRFAG